MQLRHLHLVCWCSHFSLYSLECLSLAVRLLLYDLSSSSIILSSSIMSSPISCIRNSKPLLALQALSLISSFWLFFLMLFFVLLKSLIDSGNPSVALKHALFALHNFLTLRWEVLTSMCLHSLSLIQKVWSLIFFSWSSASLYLAGEQHRKQRNFPFRHLLRACCSWTNAAAAASCLWSVGHIYIQN